MTYNNVEYDEKKKRTKKIKVIYLKAQHYFNINF
jgi:hypothetical protein